MSVAEIDPFISQYVKTGRFTNGAPSRLSFVGTPETELVFLRADPDKGVQNLWSFNLASGSEQLLVDSSDLQQGEEGEAAKVARERQRNSSSGITNYSVDRSLSTLCFVIGNEVYILDLVTKGLTRCAVDFDTEVFDVQMAPDGAKLAFVDGQALKLVTKNQDWGSTTTTILISSDKENELVAKADFVSAEEIGRSKGFWWSPDSTHLIATLVDESAVADLNLSNPAHPTRLPKLLKYPPAGGVNPKNKLLLVDLDGNQKTLDQPSSDFEYLIDVTWLENQSPVARFQDRSQQKVVDYEIDVSTGVYEEVWSHSSSRWIDALGDLRSHDRSVEIVSDETGRRLVIDDETIATTGYLRSIVAIQKDRIWFTASPDPTETHVFFIDRPSKEITQVTTDSGIHSATIGTNAIAIAKRTMSDTGTAISVYSTVDDIASKSSIGSIADLSPKSSLKVDPDFHLEDEVRLAVFKPTNHDGSSILPILMDPYGGPHAQRVIRAARPHLISQWLADKGYLVVTSDGLGTPGLDANCDFATYRDLATPALEGQKKALDIVCDKYSFADPERVGIRGWSFGGFLAALCVLEHPELFHAAVSGAPVTEWELYDTHYTERYLGKPQENKQAYEDSNLVKKAHKLSRPLLLIHGLDDDNVVPANSFRLSNELFKNRIPHETLFLDGVTHSPRTEHVIAGVLSKELDFFAEHLQSD